MPLHRFVADENERAGSSHRDPHPGAPTLADERPRARRGSALGASEVRLPADPALTLYTPPAGHAEWERRDPVEVGMDPVRVREALDYALAHETAEIPDGARRIALEEVAQR